MKNIFTLQWGPLLSLLHTEGNKYILWENGLRNILMVDIDFERLKTSHGSII